MFSVCLGCIIFYIHFLISAQYLFARTYVKEKTINLPVNHHFIVLGEVVAAFMHVRYVCSLNL